jgi:hypothetical protein
LKAPSQQTGLFARIAGEVVPIHCIDILDGRTVLRAGFAAAQDDIGA